MRGENHFSELGTRSQGGGASPEVLRALPHDLLHALLDPHCSFGGLPCPIRKLQPVAVVAVLDSADLVWRQETSLPLHVIRKAVKVRPIVTQASHFAKEPSPVVVLLLVR